MVNPNGLLPFLLHWLISHYRKKKITCWWTHRGGMWREDVLWIQVAKLLLARAVSSVTSRCRSNLCRTEDPPVLFLLKEKKQIPAFPDMLWLQAGVLLMWWHRTVWVCSTNLWWCFWNLLFRFNPSAEPSCHPALLLCKQTNKTQSKCLCCVFLICSALRKPFWYHPPQVYSHLAVVWRGVSLLCFMYLKGS